MESFIVKGYYKRKLLFVTEKPTSVEECLDCIDNRLKQHSYTGWKFKIVEI